MKVYDSPEKKKHWVKGLLSTEHISGTPGSFGAKMKLNYDFGNYKTGIIEMITKHNLPNEFHANYTLKGLRIIQENHFISTEEGFTKWISNNELQPTNFKMNAMISLMPSTFKKETKINMENFKNYMKKGISVFKPKQPY